MNNLLSLPSQSLAWTQRPGVGESCWFREYSLLLALLWKGIMSQTSLSEHLPPEIILGGDPGAEECEETPRAALPPHHSCFPCSVHFLWNYFEHLLFRQQIFTDAFQMLFVDLCITASPTWLSQHEGRATFCQGSVGLVGAGSCCHSKWGQLVTIPTWEGFSSPGEAAVELVLIWLCKGAALDNKPSV